MLNLIRFILSDRDIIRRELGQASEEENDKGVRSSGDNMYKSKSWSYTRSNIPVHSTKIKPELVRFTLDIEKISQRQPVDSFAWRKVSKNSNQTEVEERVVGDTPNIGKYIKSIDFPEEVFDTESKYLVYKGEDYPLYSFSMEKLKGEIQSIKDTKKFPYYDSIIKGIANGIYELKPVRDYFIRAIENDLSMGKAKGVGMELDIKNKDIKTFDSLIKFIENSTYTSYFKKPGEKNKKKIIHKLDIKVGTFKFSKDKSWEYSIPKKFLEDINDLVIFYKTGKMPSKKPKPIAKDSPSNTEKDSKQNSLSQDELTIKSNTIDNISLELANLGLSKLANHIGKIYIICIERNGKVAWSNFILSNNINGDLKNLSSKLKSNESIKVINCKNLSDKIKNPPLRNYERAISRKFYLPELTKYAHTQTGIILFNTLEEFVAFIHSQFHRVNDYGKLLKVGICTGTGGIDIIIKKNSISGKPTQEHC